MMIPEFIKIIDFKATTPQMSRYAVWDYALSHTYKNSENLLNEINDRIVSQNKISVESELNQQNDNRSTMNRSLWHMQESFLMSISGSSISRHTSEFNSASQNTMQNTTDVINALSNRNFNNDQNFEHYTLNLEVNTPGFIQSRNCNNEAAFNMCFKINSVLYIDKLSGSSNSEIQNQVESLKPFRSYKSIANTLSSIVKPSYFFRDGIPIRNAPEYIIPDAVPEHEVK